MKTRLLIIFTIGIIGFSGIAFAELDSSILEPFENNDLVLVGTVVDVNTVLSENKTQYDIKIEEHLKGQTSFDMITTILDESIPSDFPNDPLDYYNKPYLEKGNQVLVYLKQDGGIYKMSPYSFTIKKPTVVGPPTVIHATGPQEHFISQGNEIVISGMIKKAYLYGLEKSNLDSRFILEIFNEKGKSIESKRLTISPNGTYAYTFQDKGQLHIPGQYSWQISYENGSMGGEFVVLVDPKLWTPLKQFKSGISIDEIQCKENMVLLQKHNGSPACVKPASAIDLIKRNWLTTEEIDGYAIDYDGDVKHLPFADICTNEMKIILLIHSNISLPEEHFVMEDVALPSGMNQEKFERCAVETDFTKSRWNMVPRENEN